MADDGRDAMKRGANVALTREIPGLHGARARRAAGTPAPRRALGRQPGRRRHAVRRRRPGRCRTSTSCSSTSSPRRTCRCSSSSRRWARTTSRSRSTWPRCRPRSSASWCVLYVNEGPAQRRTLGPAARVRRAGAQPGRQRRARALRGPGRRASDRDRAGAGRGVPPRRGLEVQGARARATPRASPGSRPTTGSPL